MSKAFDGQHGLFDSLVGPYLDQHGDFPDVERAGRAVEAVRIELGGTELLQECAAKAAEAWEAETAEQEPSDGTARPRPLDHYERSYTWSEKFGILLAIRDHVYAERDEVYAKWDGDILIPSGCRKAGEQLGPDLTGWYITTGTIGRLDGVELYSLGVKDWLRELIRRCVDRGPAGAPGNAATEAGPGEGGEAGGDSKEPQKRFLFAPGLATFDGARLRLAAGFVVEVLAKLVENYGRTVTHQDLHDQSTVSEASAELRVAIREIRKELKRVKAPYRLVNKRGNGYVFGR